MGVKPDRQTAFPTPETAPWPKVPAGCARSPDGIVMYGRPRFSPCNTGEVDT